MDSFFSPLTTKKISIGTFFSSEGSEHGSSDWDPVDDLRRKPSFESLRGPTGGGVIGGVSASSLGMGILEGSSLNVIPIPMLSPRPALTVCRVCLFPTKIVPPLSEDQNIPSPNTEVGKVNSSTGRRDERRRRKGTVSGVTDFTMNPTPMADPVIRFESVGISCETDRMRFKFSGSSCCTEPLTSLELPLMVVELTDLSA